jgi:hypothetical protein
MTTTAPIRLAPFPFLDRGAVLPQALLDQESVDGLEGAGFAHLETGNVRTPVRRSVKARARSHETRKAGFTRLLPRFELEYGDAAVRLVDRLARNYPDLARDGRRTSRVARNVCYFVWWYTRDGDERLIPALFNASILLSAQDDFYDNRRIPTRLKEAFCSATNQFIGTRSFPSLAGKSRQVRELMAFWSEVAEPIRRAPPAAQAYWRSKACELNDAMAADNRAMTRAPAGFDEYMRTAIHSMGIVFVWSTYLVHKKVSMRTIRALDAILPLGATIVRLSNDIASYRQDKNRRNAVNLLGGGRSAERRVEELISRHDRSFRRRLAALTVELDVKRTILRSTDFLREFYQRSDFDRGALW